MITWLDEILCIDSDLTDLESNALEWVNVKGGAAPYRATAKKIIEGRLRSHFREIDIQIIGGEVLDLIADVEPFRQAAAYLTLHLICNDCSSGGDLFADKGSMYWGKYAEEWPFALGRLNIDKDENGTIEDSEEYNFDPGVRFLR